MDPSPYLKHRAENNAARMDRNAQKAVGSQRQIWNRLPVINLAELLPQTFLKQLATKALMLTVRVQREWISLWCQWEQWRELILPISSNITVASLQRVMCRNREVIHWQLGNHQPGIRKKGIRKKNEKGTRVVEAHHLVYIRYVSEWKLWQKKVLGSGANWSVTKWACSSLPRESIHTMAEANEKQKSQAT